MIRRSIKQKRKIMILLRQAGKLKASKIQHSDLLKNMFSDGKVHKFHDSEKKVGFDDLYKKGYIEFLGMESGSWRSKYRITKQGKKALKK